MNISEPFIKRPVMTTLVMISILFFGLMSYFNLPVSNLPSVDYPTIQVTVDNPGSNPETMAATCATPLEREFMTINGLNSISSQSITGTTNLTLQFSLDKSMDTASLDVESAINRAEPRLPKNLPYNPTYKKVNPSDDPILFYALTSPSMSLAQLYDYSNTYIGQRMSMIDGISQVITYGAAYSARIQVNPEQLAAMGMGLNQIADAIKTSNVELPTGVLYGNDTEYTINVDGQLFNAEGYNDIVIKRDDGTIVKIKQVGRALNSLRNDKYYLHYKTKTIDQPCVVLAIQRQPGANTLSVIDNIKALLPSIKKELPASLEMHTIFDQSESIIESVDDVKTTLFIAFLLVVLIIYLVLGKFINTIIPICAIPISIFGTFAVMYLLGFSIDILSLLAITLSIGFLVDDAIVVLENNVRHVQLGEDPYNASLKGSKEISMTIISMTMCLISVFIPMIFMGGIIGKVFKEFALTITTAVLISGIIALSLTPLLSSRFIPKYSEERKKGFVERFADNLNQKMLNIYKKTLTFALNYKKTILCIGMFCILSALLLFIYLPKEFLPDEDNGFLKGYSEAQDGTSPFLMSRYQKEITDIISQNKDVESVVGVASTNTDNEGLMFIQLKPYKQRSPMKTTIKTLMNNLASLPGVNSFISAMPMINLQMGYDIKGMYQYALTSIDQTTLNNYAHILETKMQLIPGLWQVSSDLQVNQPQLNFSILRDRASDLNVSAEKIETLLALAYSDQKISTINSDINQYDVIMETLPKYYKDPSVVSQLFIKSETNDIVALDEVVKADSNTGPLSVNHINGLPSATISFNLADIPLSTALTKIENLSSQILPVNISATEQGSADIFKQSFANLTFLLLITFFVIYIILGILYENFIHPLTVMSTLAPATFGGLFMLFIFNETLSLFSFIGLILLIGIVMKNGIIMVDFANENIKQNKSAYDAIYEACISRFRPIMMTTFAALMGAVPIALGFGGSTAPSRRPLGIVIVGGLIISQILTLYLTPVTYYYLEKIKENIHRKKNQGLG